MRPRPGLTTGGRGRDRSVRRPRGESTTNDRKPGGEGLTSCRPGRSVQVPAPPGPDQASLPERRAFALGQAEEDFNHRPRRGRGRSGPLSHLSYRPGPALRRAQPTTSGLDPEGQPPAPGRAAPPAPPPGQAPPAARSHTRTPSTSTNPEPRPSPPATTAPRSDLPGRSSAHNRGSSPPSIVSESSSEFPLPR